MKFVLWKLILNIIPSPCITLYRLQRIIIFSWLACVHDGYYSSSICLFLSWYYKKKKKIRLPKFEWLIFILYIQLNMNMNFDSDYLDQHPRLFPGQLRPELVLWPVPSFRRSFDLRDEPTCCWQSGQTSCRDRSTCFKKNKLGTLVVVLSISWK